jgi:CDGSH-type Zn-finger protein
MSELPIVADNKPKKVSLEKDQTYYFCVCGRSQNQPFCDGSHKVTSSRPTAFMAGATDNAFLCMCKHTKNAPFCDGSHKQFSLEMVGKEGPGVVPDQ